MIIELTSAGREIINNEKTYKDSLEYKALDKLCRMNQAKYRTNMRLIRQIIWLESNVVDDKPIPLITIVEENDFSYIKLSLIPEIG